MSNQISEEAPAKGKEAPAAAEGGVEQGSEKKIRQAVYDIRYRARREEIDLRHAFSQYLGNSNLNQQEKTAVQEKLFGKEGGGGAPAEQAESLAIESIANVMHKVFSENKTCCKKCGSYEHVTKDCPQDVKESASDEKYKVRVKDKEKDAYVRYADRAKINQLRSNPQISSVEMTGHGDPYEGDKDKKATTSSIKKKPSKDGKKDEISGKDKKIDLKKEEYLADGAAVAPPKNKKITGEKVDNSKLIKVFPQDQSDPQIGNIKSSYKPVGQVVSEILSKEAYTVTAADEKGNTPAWKAYKSGKKNVKTGEPLYKAADHLKKEGVEVKMEGDDDTPATVDALLDTINSKNNEDGRAMYTKWNLAKNKLRAIGLKMSHEPEGEMTEGRVGAAVGGGVGGTVGKKAGAAAGALAGGAAGAIGGPLGIGAGAAIGGVVGSKVGGAAGGGVGAATGDVVGSAVRGKKAKNPLKTGAAGAVGGAVGGGAGAAIGGLATGADKVKKEEYVNENRRAARAAGGFVDDSKKQTDPSKAGFTGISDDIGEIMKQNAAMKAAEKKKTKKEGYTNVVEDIADILARLEKKRISKGGDPDESPLGKKTGRAMKDQQDKARKKAGLKTEHHQTDADGNEIPHEEIDESSLVKKLTRPIRKAKRVGKRLLDTLDSDPGRAHTIGTLGNPNVKNEDERARQRKNQKKYRGVKVKEEVASESTLVRDILSKKN